MNEIFYGIPLFSLINGLFFAKSLMVGEIKLYILLAFLLMGLLTSLSILKKKLNIYTVFSAIYLLLGLLNFEINKYVGVGIVILWAVMHVLNHKKNKVYLFIAYTAALALYNFVIIDLKWDEITLAIMLGYLGYVYLLSRRVLGKLKAVEYILTSIIYLVALFLYPDITNAIIFTSFLVLMVILGYQKKIGPLFLTSMIFIVLNAYKLTFDFWRSIPWWIYLVTAGGLLLVFAIRNEAEATQHKERLQGKIQKIREKVDL